MLCFSANKKRQRRDGQASRMPRCASGVRALPAPGTAKEAGLGTCDRRNLTFPSPSWRRSTQVSTRWPEEQEKSSRCPRVRISSPWPATRDPPPF